MPAMNTNHPGGRLVVVRDGVELPEEQARALWRAFSEHMDRNERDLDGFARAHGFVSVKPEHRRGRAVLVVTTSQSIPPPPAKAKPPVRADTRAPTRAVRPTAVKGRSGGSRR
jgi:hypothetical protein